MRKNKFLMFSAAAFALAFAACTNDDVVKDNPITTDTSFVNVKIVMGGNSNGTRAGEYAAADEEFDSGIADEARVHNLAVYLYDGKGNLVGKGSKADFDDPTAGKNNVSDTYNGVIEVTLIPGAAQPEYLMAFVNATDVPEDVLSNLDNQKVSSLGDLENGLVMSTSRYYDGDTENVWFKGTPVTSDDIYDTFAEATNTGKALEIYVERLAAKMTVDKVNESIETTADQRLYDLDGNEYKIVFNVKKWAATGTAPEMYYVKNAFDGRLNSWANDKDNFRSYWAKGALYDTNYGDMTSKLTYLSANQILYTESDKGLNLGSDNAAYVPEHTYGENALKTPYDQSNPNLPRYYNHMLTATSAIVVGQYSLVATGAGNADNFSNGKDGYDFYLSLRGFDGENETLTVYNEWDLVKTLLGRNFKKFTTDQEGNSPLTEENYSDYVELKKNNDREKLYTLVSKGETLYCNGAEADFSTDFQATIAAAHYKDGWAYFFIPVVHNQNLDEDTQEGAVGVVRNHSYKIHINSIKGLGAPLDEDKVGDDPENTPPTDPDPDDPDPEDPGDTPIIPDPDMLRNAYIDATLNVLSWHNAKDQYVDLK